MSDIDYDELVNYVGARLYERDGDNDDLPMELLLPDYRYSLAKQRARAGDLKPLQEILTSVMRDPELADFISVPPQQPWPKHVRKDLALSKPYREYGRYIRSQTLQEVRKILIEEKGYRAYGINDLLATVTAKVLLGNAKEPKDPTEEAKEVALKEELLDIINRGYRL